MDRREMFTLSFPGARLNDDAKRVAKVLFSDGDDVGYGRLFRAAFNFTPRITESNNHILREVEKKLIDEANLASADDVFRLGIHLRHTNNRDINGSDYGEMGCLKKVLAEANPTNKRCILLVASDRAQALSRMRETAGQIGCVFTTSNHSMIHQQYGEHGPFWGEIAMADIELLSRSDFFVGSSYTNFGSMTSTYSMVISGLVATTKGSYPLNNYKELYEKAKLELEKLLASRMRRSRRALAVDEHMSTIPTSRYVKWLPTCDVSIGAKYNQPDPIYANGGKGMTR